MQISDTSVVGRTGRYFSQQHDLMPIGTHWFWETIDLPAMQNGSKQTDMGTAYPRIILIASKNIPNGDRTCFRRRWDYLRS